MSFTLSESVNPEKVFVEEKARLATSRWDPSYYRHMRVFMRRLESCPHPVEKLRDGIEFIQYGSSERATEEPVGVPMLRMSNLQNDSWDLSELKYITLDDAERQKYLLRQGDLLFNRTNSKELVGKCKVFDLPDAYVFASYLIRVRLDQQKLLPSYVKAYLASTLGERQIEAVSRQIVGMTNINTEEIGNLLVPVPPHEVQREVVEKWRSAIRQRDHGLEEARRLLNSIGDVLLKRLGVDLPDTPSGTIQERMFRRPFAGLTAERWDPLFHERDVFEIAAKSRFPTARLHEVTRSIQTGFAAGRSDQAHDGGIVHIRPTNVTADGGLTFDRNVYIDASEAQDRPSDLLQKGEVLFNNTNSQEQVGKTVFFDRDGAFFCSNHMTRLGVDPARLAPTYLYHVLNLYQREDVFYRICTNWNNQSGVGTDVLQKIAIPLPPLSKQNAIAKELDEIRGRAKEMKQQAERQLNEAKADIEAMILGEDV